jgi:hypothetical protein
MLAASPAVLLVGGQVKMPKWANVLALQQLPHVSQNVTYFAAGQVENDTFTGALLWDLLQSVGILTNPNVKNDILRKIIVVTGTDGYVSVFTAREIDPGFGGNQIIVAYEDNRQPLGCEGPAQIVRRVTRRADASSTTSRRSSCGMQRSDARAGFGDGHHSLAGEGRLVWGARPRPWDAYATLTFMMAARAASSVVGSESGGHSGDAGTTAPADSITSRPADAMCQSMPSRSLSTRQQLERCRVYVIQELVIFRLDG